ncbi:PLP-dependent aminotransferase family protein [Streptomyces scopuliridis]|uniref:aminotransferase-like domain-containing protein n=1 Tax=Streptomyces scopuliridis TaxID=452529 RepID=UPI003698CA17
MQRDIVADFTRSIPPAPPEAGDALAGTLGAIAADPGARMLLHESKTGGGPEDRVAAARWMARRMPAPEPRRLLLTNGTQSSLLLVLRHLAAPGDVVLAEGLTYAAIGNLAERARVHLHPVDLDDDGMIPESLDAACRKLKPRLIYCNPSYHNPTTTTMSLERRHQIAAVARHHGVPIFEDDVLGALHPQTPPPIATLAPELTWYSMGLTKSLTQGLRVGYLLGPGEPAVEALLRPITRLSYWVANPLSAEVVRRWIDGGQALAIADAIHRESAARQELATQLLHGLPFDTQDAAMHLWLRVPPGHTSRSYARAAAERGVLVRPAEMFAVDGHPVPPRVRLSLSTPLDRAQVRRGLEIISTLSSHERWANSVR